MDKSKSTENASISVDNCILVFRSGIAISFFISERDCSGWSCCTDSDATSLFQQTTNFGFSTLLKAKIIAYLFLLWLFCQSTKPGVIVWGITGRPWCVCARATITALDGTVM